MSNDVFKNSSVKQYQVEEFFSIRTIVSFALSPDSKKIFYITNTTGKPQIWEVSINGGYTRQISVWGESIRGVHHNPKRNELIFHSDTNGNEQLQIYSMPSSGGDVMHIAGSNQSQTEFVAFNKQGNKIIYSTNTKRLYNFDTFIYDLDTRKHQLVKEFKEKYTTFVEAWSRDERYILFVKVYGNLNMDLLLYDTKTKKFSNTTKHDLDDDELNFDAKFDKNGKGFYYISDTGSEFKGIRYYSIKDKKSEWVIREKWDVTGFTLSDDNSFMIYTVNIYGSNTPILFRFKNGKKESLKLPKGNYNRIKLTKDSNKIVYIMDSPLNPTDIFTYDLKSKKVTKITESLVGGLSSKGFTKARDVFYKSFDGVKIHALLYIPKGLKKDGKNPAIVWPHGGPEWQEIHNFSKYIQVMTNAGYIVIAPNFRGSTGYGKTFQKMIYRDWGGDEFKDVLCSVDYLKNTGYVNPRKIAVVGGSFGGFMTLTCITKAPDIWKCAVDIFGPSNLFTFLDSVPEHWKSSTVKLIGDMNTDREMLKERSPINFVDKIKCPLLVIQGKHDPRVVEAESSQIVSKLKKNGKAVEYLMLEDEGHGFSKVSNQIKVFKSKLDFLNKHLR